MNDEKIRVVMIGIGHAHSVGVMEEFLTQKDTFQVLGFVEKNDKILSEKGKIYPFNRLQLLKEEDVFGNLRSLIDAVIIETEMNDLVPTAMMYLSLKVPIHLDKPSGNGSDFLRLLDKAKDMEIPIQLGYMYRFNSAILTALDYIKEDKVGDICYINAFIDTELDQTQRKSLNNFTGGIMYVYGCHMLDIILKFQGKPKSIYSFIKQSGFDGIGAKDSTVALLEYDHGLSVVRATGVDANGYGRRQIVISGSKGSIEIKPIENPTKMTYAARDGQRAYENKATDVVFHKYPLRTRYYYMVKNFAFLIRKEFNHMLFPIDYKYESELHKLISQSINVSE